jgi:protein associated with RNAse G/E
VTVPPDSTGHGFLERKRKADGTLHEYETDLVHRDKTVVIVRFVLTRDGGPPRLPVSVSAGTVSYGYFWPRRPYNVYRWISPEGKLIAHRFDAVTAVKVSEHEVDYRDLVLDWWAFPDGSIVEEDRDELDEAVAAGLVTPAEAQIANEAAYQVLSRYRHIIDEVEALERKWVR